MIPRPRRRTLAVRRRDGDGAEGPAILQSMQPTPRAGTIRSKKNSILAVAFREGHASRLALARALNLNASMIGSYVEELLRDGLLLEDHAGGTRRGRRPVTLRLNPDHGAFVGVDFDASRARAVLTDFTGRILASGNADLPARPDAGKVLAILSGLARRTARKAGRLPLLGTGIVAPGAVDTGRGRVIRYDLIPGFTDVPLLDHFRSAWETPVFVENNIRSWAIAEMIRGAGRGCRDVLFLVARTGLGLGVVLGGEIRTGVRGLAGTVGFSYVARGRRFRRMTELVSSTALLREALALARRNGRTAGRKALLKRGARAQLADVVGLAEAGDAEIAALLGNAGRELGLLAVNLVHLFSPERLILAGEVPGCSPLLRRPFEETFDAQLFDPFRGGVTVVDSETEEFGAALGGAFHAFSCLYPTGSRPAAVRPVPLPE